MYVFRGNVASVHVHVYVLGGINVASVHVHMYIMYITCLHVHVYVLGVNVAAVHINMYVVGGGSLLPVMNTGNNVHMYMCIC